MKIAKENSFSLGKHFLFLDKKWILKYFCLQQELKGNRKIKNREQIKENHMALALFVRDSLDNDMHKKRRRERSSTPSSVSTWNCVWFRAIFHLAATSSFSSSTCYAAADICVRFIAMTWRLKAKEELFMSSSILILWHLKRAKSVCRRGL